LIVTQLVMKFQAFMEPEGSYKSATKSY